MRRLFATATLAWLLAIAFWASASAGADPGVADTIRINPVFWDGDTAFTTVIYAANDEALKQATIVLGWSSNKIGIDSVSLVGSRWASQVSMPAGYFVADTGRVSGTASQTRYTIAFLPFTSLLPTGSGPVCRVFWKRTGAVVTDPTIVIDTSRSTGATLASVYTLFGDSPYPAGNWLPVSRPDTIHITPCLCDHQGDVINNDSVVDVFDVIQEIAIAFSGGLDVQDPFCPTTRGDVVNQDLAVDVFDVIQEIAIAFSGGTPGDSCAP